MPPQGETVRRRNGPVAQQAACWEPPPDPSLPQLGLVTDADRITSLLRAEGLIGQHERLKPTYLRYKPLTNCIVRCDLAGADVPWGYVKISAADRPFRPSDRFRLTGYLAHRRMAVCRFPSDLQMPAVRMFAEDPNGALLEGLLEDPGPAREAVWTPVRYKPERRCVARIRWLGGDPGDGVYLRFYADREMGCAARLREELAATPAAATVPPLVGFNQRPRVMATAEIEGMPLESFLSCPRAFLGPVLDATAEALAGWHQLSAPAFLPHRGEADGLAACAAMIKTLLPDAAGRVESLLESLHGNRPPEGQRCALLHGDFYHDQVLVGASGRVRFVDLDETAAGDPLIDLASFSSHLELLVQRGRLSGARARWIAQRFRSRYEEAAGISLNRRRLHWHEAACLLKLALWPFRRLEPDWRVGVAGILAAAERTGDSS